MTPLRRSLHFVPGGNDRMLAKSLATNADCLILDLEDAVTPDSKGDVRREVANWLADVDFGGKERAVRINPLDTPWGYRDLEVVMATPPDVVMLPKPESSEDVEVLDLELARLERRHGHAAGAVGLILLAGETATAALRAPAMTECPRVKALTWGAEDLAVSLGAPSSRNEAGAFILPCQHARTMTLLSAAAAGVQPVDTVYVDFRDVHGLERECAEAAAMGFAGKLSIHPNQIEPINVAFSPTEEQVEKAAELVAAFEEAQATGQMAFTFDGQMVDAPHLARAKALLARATAIEGDA